MPIGISTPLTLSQEQVPWLATTTIAAEAAENLKALILTKEGELSWEPGFGVGLESYLFEHDTTSLRSDLTARIEKQIATYIGFIELLDIQYTDVADSGVLSVTIAYAVSSAGILGEQTNVGFVFDEPTQTWSMASEEYLAGKLGEPKLNPSP